MYVELACELILHAFAETMQGTSILSLRSDRAVPAELHLPRLLPTIYHSFLSSSTTLFHLIFRASLKSHRHNGRNTS